MNQLYEKDARGEIGPLSLLKGRPVHTQVGGFDSANNWGLRLEEVMNELGTNQIFR
jgi:hypothetical protein